ncbi:hypothetical protein [Defluviicoccus vanus]|uniref:Uncharacterized protein n=1 Tax=Defluviicoccus vanus TaxID=111831 RepID=A0A7H1N1E2_9PROT|nr:hypothetical protein [Defluviicoccus vanus]QNT69528.1 hypothetical protein HQ394_09520 [Defluviicoccus vanus]
MQQVAGLAEAGDQVADQGEAGGNVGQRTGGGEQAHLQIGDPAFQVADGAGPGVASAASARSSSRFVSVSGGAASSSVIVFSRHPCFGIARAES